nr:GIY-YIG nuclease family protein [Barnesiella sp. An55]
MYSRTRDRYYVGYTHDIAGRLGKHNAGATPSTRSGRPWELVYSESYAEKRAAISREREIKDKKSRVYIEQLIAKG